MGELQIENVSGWTAVTRDYRISGVDDTFAVYDTSKVRFHPDHVVVTRTTYTDDDVRDGDGLEVVLSGPRALAGGRTGTTRHSYRITTWRRDRATWPAWLNTLVDRKD